MGSRLLVLWLAMVMVLVGLSKGDLDKDKQQCAQKLIELSACLPYVSGQAKGPPTPACCDALKPVLQTSKVCLCILVKDRDDPKLGLKINANLALGLPDSCHLPSNITECPKLLNLSPKSPEAKIFEDYKSNNTTTASSGNESNEKSGSSGDVKSDGGIRGKKWLGVEMICGFLYIIVMFLFQIA
nr:protein YLS3-like [Tanacetum cinerariifolium]